MDNWIIKMWKRISKSFTDKSVIIKPVFFHYEEHAIDPSKEDLFNDNDNYMEGAVKVINDSLVS